MTPRYPPSTTPSPPKGCSSAAQQSPSPHPSPLGERRSVKMSVYRTQLVIHGTVPDAGDAALEQYSRKRAGRFSAPTPKKAKVIRTSADTAFGLAGDEELEQFFPPPMPTEEGRQWEETRGARRQPEDVVSRIFSRLDAVQRALEATQTNLEATQTDLEATQTKLRKVEERSETMEEDIRRLGARVSSFTHVNEPLFKLELACFLVRHFDRTTASACTTATSWRSAALTIAGGKGQAGSKFRKEMAAAAYDSIPVDQGLILKIIKAIDEKVIDERNVVAHPSQRPCYILNLALERFRCAQTALKDATASDETIKQLTKDEYECKALVALILRCSGDLDGHGGARSVWEELKQREGLVSPTAEEEELFRSLL